MENYSTKSTSVSGEFESNDPSHKYGYSKSDVYDWLANIVLPIGYKVCNIIEIKFKGSRKEFYLNHKNTYFKNGELVVVEGNMGGYDVGHVSLIGELVNMQLKKKNVRKEEVVKKIYRSATPDDLTKWKLAKEMELDTLYEEANRIGGVGPCGSYLCCHTWPTDFKTGFPWVSRDKKIPNINDKVINLNATSKMRAKI